MEKVNINLVMAAILSIFIYSCGNDDEAPPSNPNLIDASGGVVISEQSDLTINIPPGALSTPTEITIVETTTHPAGNLGVVYDLGPDGTKFNSPVSLTFEYDPSNIPVDRDENDLVVAFAENGSWIPLNNNVVDNGNNTVTATTDHFTPFTVFLIKMEEEIVPPSNLTYEPNEYDIIPDQNLATQTPSIQGDAPFTYTISAYDPEVAIENFTINAETGVVSFTGSSVFSTGAEQVILDVSIENSGGSITVEDALTFNLIYPPASLEYNPNKTVFFPGEMYDSGVPTIQGTAPFTFTLGELPQGLIGSELDIDNLNGQITGTLSQNAQLGDYSLSVTVSNTAGERTVADAIDLTIDQAPVMFPDKLTYDISTDPSGNGLSDYWSVFKNFNETIELVTNIDEGFTFILQDFYPEPEGTITVDSETGAISYAGSPNTMTTTSYIEIDLVLQKGGESRRYDRVVVLREIDAFDYLIDYQPREYTLSTSPVSSSLPDFLEEPAISSPIYSIEFVSKKTDSGWTAASDEILSQGIISVNVTSGVVTFNDPSGDYQFNDYYVSLRVTNEVNQKYSLFEGAIVFRKP